MDEVHIPCANVGGAFGRAWRAWMVVLEREVVTPGTHVCWVVDGASRYLEGATAVLADSRVTGHKTMVFGPAGSATLHALDPVAALSADPRISILDAGRLVPGPMLDAIRREAALALDEGYDGLTVMADMDWLLPLDADTHTIVGFELLLDEVVAELGTTVICAYQRASFEPQLIMGALGVHPARVGHHDEPPFRLVSAGDGRWVLAGEIDASAAPLLQAVLPPALQRDPCEVDVSDLRFIDAAGMRALAHAAVTARVGLRLRAPRIDLQRWWGLMEFPPGTPVEIAA